MFYCVVYNIGKKHPKAGGWLHYFRNLKLSRYTQGSKMNHNYNHDEWYFYLCFSYIFIFIPHHCNKTAIERMSKCNEKFIKSI